MVERDDNLELPEGLRRDLSTLYGARKAAPAERDVEILAAARRAGRGYGGRWRMMVGTGIAAAVALAIGIAWDQYGSRNESYARTGDIRDAFYVARQIKAHRALPASWDANGDGVVDEKDVQMLALAAVKIGGEKGGGSP